MSGINQRNHAKCVIRLRVHTLAGWTPRMGARPLAAADQQPDRAAGSARTRKLAP